MNMCIRVKLKNCKERHLLVITIGFYQIRCLSILDISTPTSTVEMLNKSSLELAVINDTKTKNYITQITTNLVLIN